MLTKHSCTHPVCEKVAPKSLAEKCEIKGDSQEMPVIIRSLMVIMTIQCPPPSFTRTRHQIHLNFHFLPLNYHCSHFLAATFDFTSFLPKLFGAEYFFYSLTVFVQISLFYNCIFIMQPMASFGAVFFTCPFILYRHDAER